MHVTTCHTSWKHNIQDFLRDYETNLLILFSARLLYSFCPRFLQTTAAGLVNGCSRPKNTEHNTPIWKIIALVTCESQDWFFFYCIIYNTPLIYFCVTKLSGHLMLLCSLFWEFKQNVVKQIVLPVLHLYYLEQTSRRSEVCCISKHKD